MSFFVAHGAAVLAGLVLFGGILLAAESFDVPDCKVTSTKALMTPVKIVCDGECCWMSCLDWSVGFTPMLALFYVMISSQAWPCFPNENNGACEMMIFCFSLGFSCLLLSIFGFRGSSRSQRRGVKRSRSKSWKLLYFLLPLGVACATSCPVRAHAGYTIGKAPLVTGDSLGLSTAWTYVTLVGSGVFSSSLARNFGLRGSSRSQKRGSQRKTGLTLAKSGLWPFWF